MMRRSIAAVSVFLCAAVVNDASAQIPSGDDVHDVRVGAWDQSVRLEKQGKVEEARAVLMRAWGAMPEGYEVTVRLGWLSLQLRDLDSAIAYYDRARSLPGASDESMHGLASAYTQRGFAELERNDRPSARQDFRAALTLDADQAEARRGLAIAGPASRIDPELWFAYLHQSLPKKKWTGAALFAHVPWQPNDVWRLRLAYRYLTSETDLQAEQAPSGAPRLRDVNTTDEQHELYGGVRYGAPWVDIEALGIAVFPSSEDTVLGAGFQLRLGRRYGVLIEGASLRRESGWNHQFIPGLYYWPTGSIGLAAGLRDTTDALGTDVSAWAGFSLRSDRTELHVRGHRGTERWAVSIAEPSILTIDAETTAGVEATLLLPLSGHWQLGLEADVEKLDQLAERGIYFSTGLGLRWSPSLPGGPL